MLPRAAAKTGIKFCESMLNLGFNALTDVRSPFIRLKKLTQILDSSFDGLLVNSSIRIDYKPLVRGEERSIRSIKNLPSISRV